MYFCENDFQILNYMNKNTFLTALDSLTGKALNVTAVILLSFSCIWLAGVLLVRYISFFDNISFIEPVKSLLKYICILLFVLFLILIALRLCLSPFVPSQEEKDFEAKVDYILAKKKSQHVDSPARNAIVDSPLSGLTLEQEQIVCSMLANLPSHDKYSDHINMAYVAQFLTALSELGYIRNENNYMLRAWVEKVTGKYVPEQGKFNEAYPSSNKKKVLAVKQRIQASLQVM